jgi:hypothetical protein
MSEMNYYSNNTITSSRRRTGKNSWIVLVLMLFLYIAIGHGIDIVKYMTCKSQTKGTVVDTIHRTPRTVKNSNGKRKKSTNNSQADFTFEVNGKSYKYSTPWMKNVPSKGASDTIYYNESDPNKCYAECYMDEVKYEIGTSTAVFAVIILLMLVSGKKSNDSN